MNWTEVLTATITVIGGVLTAYIGVSVKKHSNKNDEILSKINSNTEELKHINDKLKDYESIHDAQQLKLTKISNDLDENNLRTLRLDLLHAIESDPNNQLVIMDLARKYFVEMKGNCYMSKIFQEWADEHNVNITSMFNKE